MGIAPDRPEIEHSAKGYNIVSDGIPTGAMQVPGNGLPLILLADRQTTGGYPKIATVISWDLPRLVQMPARHQGCGSQAVDRAEAVRIARAADAGFARAGRETPPGRPRRPRQQRAAGASTWSTAWSTRADSLLVAAPEELCSQYRDAEQHVKPRAHEVRFALVSSATTSVQSRTPCSPANRDCLCRSAAPCARTGTSTRSPAARSSGRDRSRCPWSPWSVQCAEQ